ncbi:PadR family transcriptional regulator [Cohnella sp. JJ-181]|uniref:PadR family transcriptional regulator n=1 Tax=Cohnella rhizoplanae TaxID=2974897 RepID=UPI0023310B32|nr:PadR family transcriptional regulator [Cohnella sp. JJ-181]
MEFVILGLLLLRDLTQYEVKTILERRVSPFFSASLGSIQAAFKKLEREGHVDRREVADGGRIKKVYSITAAGRPYFFEWMLAAADSNRLDKEVTTKLFFLGLLTLAERQAVVAALVGKLEETVRQFEAASAEAGRQPAPDPYAEIAKYQLKTLELGLYHHRSMLSWFRSLLEEIEGEARRV